MFFGFVLFFTFYFEIIKDLQKVAKVVHRAPCIVHLSSPSGPPNPSDGQKSITLQVTPLEGTSTQPCNLSTERTTVLK